MSHINKQLTSTRNHSIARSHMGGRVSISNIFNCLDQTNKYDKADCQTYANKLMKQLDALCDNEKKHHRGNVSKIAEKVQSACDLHAQSFLGQALGGFDVDIIALEKSLAEYTKSSDEALKAVENSVLLMKRSFNDE